MHMNWKPLPTSWAVFVRDLILKRPSLDFDIVIEGNAIELSEAIAADFGGKMTSHSRFGTAKWRIDSIRDSLAKQLSSDTVLIQSADLPASLDFISSRTEFYDYPTALPTVERSSIKLDLHRRDFTINTLALRLDGAYYGDLYDHWGGLHDLERGWCAYCIPCPSSMILPVCCAPYALNNALVSRSNPAPWS